MNFPKLQDNTWTHGTALWTVSVAAVGLYVFSEWIFFVTKPSFMSTLSFWDKFRILTIAPLPLIAGCTAFICILWATARLVKHAFARYFLLLSARMAPAFFFGATFFLLLDNFTYTLFDFGIQSAYGFRRYLYFAIFIFLSGWGLRICSGIEKSLSLKKRLVAARLVAASLTCAFAATLVFASDFSILKITGPRSEASPQAKRPNVLLISSDGLDADHLSVYGYERDTTPFMAGYCQGKSLFCENAFPNAANTSGSIASMLTGKLPTQIRVYYPPEILMGKNAYEHLPGILRQYGYINIDISIRQFADAYDLNMRNAFDVANDRKLRHTRFQAWMPALLGQNATYFLGQTYERLKNRLRYALGMTDFISSYDEVAGRNKTGGLNDEPRIRMLLSFFKEVGEQPFFAHVHLLGTHGEYFYPKKRVFSQGQTQSKIFMKDFYDDAILEFDHYMEQIVTALEIEGKLKNTIIVIGSDHGKRFQSGVRIPLIFLFPDGAHSSRITANTQNLDIAPTLLDYLKIPKPAWMGGRSLLNTDLDRFYPIFSMQVNSDRVKAGVWVVDDTKNDPPFYSLGNVAVNICSKTFRLFVDKPEFIASTVTGHTDPCAEDQIPSDTTVKKILFDHLEQNGYDIFSLKAWEQTLNKGN